MNVDSELSRKLQDVAKDLSATLEGIAGKKVGFGLVVFQTNTSDGFSSWVSNCPRDQMMIFLREFLGRWERGEPDQPIHERN